MVAWIKKHFKPLLILADVMIFPGMLLCRWLTSQMLSTNSPCPWTLFGGKCVTCGGTHFVNDLSNFRIGAALQDNVFLFALTIFLGVSFIFLNLWKVFNISFFQKVLKKMYNIPVLIIWLAIMLIFLLIRVAPAFINIFHLIAS